MKKFSLVSLLVALPFATVLPAVAQTSSAPAGDSPAAAELSRLPWEYGPFFQGGKGVGNRSDYTLLSAGFRLGKVITDPHLGSIFRGQFEYADRDRVRWAGRSCDRRYRKQRDSHGVAQRDHVQDSGDRERRF